MKEMPTLPPVLCVERQLKKGRRACFWDEVTEVVIPSPEVGAATKTWCMAGYWLR